MVKKRNDLEICANILRIAKEGAKKSHIVYQANLNFTIVNKYLNRLQEMGLIVFPSDDDPCFKTTSKGFEYLDQYAIVITTFSSARSAEKDSEAISSLEQCY